MYYSYKSKRKKRKIFKILLLVLTVSCIFYLGAKYHQYIFFWKYTFNKICIELDAISKIDDNEKKKLRLQEISEICREYNNKKQISAEAFFLTGKIHFQLGENYLNKTFSEFIMSNCSGCVNQKASSEFLNAIKNIRKGMALYGSDEIDSEYRLIMAKSCFYNNYYNIQDTYKIVEKVSNVESLSNIDDIRFLSIINILNKKEEYGLELLTKYGMANGDSVNGRFFLASAYSIAGKYTDSIISFKFILNNCSDNNLIKLANINLGKIYFNQSLYKESLAHFSNALRIDERDNLLKIWIGKNYSALGEKLKAKAIWSEVLASDHTNKEARKLLGLM